MLIATLLATALAFGAFYHTPAVHASSDLSTITSPDIIAHAQSWLNPQVPYNQQGNHNGYRQDCSGYVSMAWGLATPGLTTYTLPTVSHQINKNDLRPGDVLNNQNGGGNPDFAHVVIFESWADSEHNHYNGYEESPYYGGAHHTTGIPYPYWSGYDPQGYVPMRLNTLGGTSTLDSSQLVFLDQTPGNQIYSIDVSGPNQDGVQTNVCWQTPTYETVLGNRWWASTTYVTLYTDSNCQNYYGGGLYFNSDNAPYRCLQDVDPYSDWDCSP